MYPPIVTTIGRPPAERQRISRDARAGVLRRIAARIYTSDKTSPLEDVVRRHWLAIAGALYPDGVIGHRTALEGGPGKHGVAFITHGGRPRNLPGLSFRTTSGAGPLAQDISLPSGLYMSGPTRALLENLSPSRSSQFVSRTVGAAAVEAELDRKVSTRGERELTVIRDEARAVAPQLGMQAEYQQLQRLISGLLGTNQHGEPLTVAGRSRASGEPIDGNRMADFEALAARLAATTLPLSLAPTHDSPDERATYWRNAAFFESYFSNYIEGTEFELEEARAIVYDAKIPDARPADAHDILGVYRVVADEGLSNAIALRPEDFLSRLRDLHSTVFSGRPDISPGAFKTIANRAGEYSFVAPANVVGTLKAGFRMIDQLTDPMSRAVFMHHLVSEVHPFADGNGRLSRLFMNAELSRAGLRRVIVPTILREDYLTGVRLISRERDPSTLARVIDASQRLQERVDFADYDKAAATFTEAHAFARASSDVRLEMPRDGSSPASSNGLSQS